MTEKNTFYIEFYERFDDKTGITVHADYPLYMFADIQEHETLDVGVFDITYKSLAGGFYSTFNVYKMECDENNRYCMIEIETEKSMKEIARIINDFYSLITTKTVLSKED